MVVPLLASHCSVGRPRDVRERRIGTNRKGLQIAGCKAFWTKAKMKRMVGSRRLSDRIDGDNDFFCMQPLHSGRKDLFTHLKFICILNLVQ